MATVEYTCEFAFYTVHGTLENISFDNDLSKTAFFPDSSFPDTTLDNTIGSCMYGTPYFTACPRIFVHNSIFKKADLTDLHRAQKS